MIKIIYNHITINLYLLVTYYLKFLYHLLVFNIENSLFLNLYTLYSLKEYYLGEFYLDSLDSKRNPYSCEFYLPVPEDLFRTLPNEV